MSFDARWQSIGIHDREEWFQEPASHWFSLIDEHGQACPFRAALLDQPACGKRLACGLDPIIYQQHTIPRGEGRALEE